MSVNADRKPNHVRVGILLGLMLVGALALAACQPSQVASVGAAAKTTAQKTEAAVAAAPKTEAVPAATMTEVAQEPAAAAAPIVMLHEDAKLGKILVDSKGMTLYVFDKDVKDKSNCNGDSAVKWSPLTVKDENEKLMSGEGVSGALTVVTDDGTYEVAINGMPLYYYQPDKNAGDTNGQAVGSVWWVVGADGNKITKE